MCTLIVRTFFFLSITHAAFAATPWITLVVGNASETEQLATRDFERYVAQVIGAVPERITPEVWQAQPRSALVIGTPDNNLLLKKLALDTSTLGEDGFRIDETTTDDAKIIAVAGVTPRGAVNALYGLLREVGFGFYLGHEAVPDTLPETLSRPSIIGRPTFGIRGVLPWYNFFNSPTTWDPIDHRAFVDQLIRMGANFVGFHTYDSEPFAAVDEGGVMKWGEPLLNTNTPTWGTHSLKTSEFGYGTGMLFKDEYFGAESSLLGKSRDETIRVEQNIMRDALDYAKKRGLHPCLGFECTDDPLDPSVRDVFLKRLNHVLDQYPALEYVWIWQPEAEGVAGFKMPHESKTALPLYAAARRETFRRIIERVKGEQGFLRDTGDGKMARALEAARLEQFGRLAHACLQRRTGAPRLVISGWGGDERLLSAEYYEGLDKLLPPDIVFASLDHIFPRPRVDSIYNELSASRQRWPIPWFECDGDQWHAQPHVHTLEYLLRDANRGGSQGILGIHWRTRDVSEDLAYTTQFAWNPALTAEEFFKDYARRIYGPELAEPMSFVHSSLDYLGYRWVGGAGQVECGGFAWGPGDMWRVNSLRALRETVSSLQKSRTPDGKHKTEIQALLDRIDWTLAYQDAEAAADKARHHLADARAGSGDAAKLAAQEALDMLDDDALARALRAYAQCLCTRGEYGVLATINTKAVVDWRALRQDCLSILGKPEAPTAPSWQPEPRILMPRFIASTIEAQELELLPVVLGGKAAYAHYRGLGDATWKTVPLEPVRGWVFRAIIPAANVQAPGIQIAFSFNPSPGNAVNLGPLTVTVMPNAEVSIVPPPRLEIPAEPKLVATQEKNSSIPAAISWNVPPGTDYFRVYRDGALVAETAVPFFPDSPAATKCVYTIEAVRDSQVVSKSDPLEAAVIARALTTAPHLRVRANQAAVVGEIGTEYDPYVVAYEIKRSKDGSAAETLKPVKAALDSKSIFRDAPPGGHWTYSVVGVNAAGEQSPGATGVVDFPPPPPKGPALDVALNAKPDGASVAGTVKFETDGARFANGYICIPSRPEMHLGVAMTLEFEFNAADVSGMPVLISHGQWQVDGWFVQILGGSLIFRAPNGDANGPPIEPNKLYKVRVFFDGEQLHMCVNGKWIEQRQQTIHPIDAERDLVIGAYQKTIDTYAFRGRIANVKLYNDALLD